jgi:hypothetical protein
VRVEVESRVWQLVKLLQQVHVKREKSSIKRYELESTIIVLPYRFVKSKNETPQQTVHSVRIDQRVLKYDTSTIC